MKKVPVKLAGMKLDQWLHGGKCCPECGQTLEELPRPKRAGVPENHDYRCEECLLEVCHVVNMWLVWDSASPARIEEAYRALAERAMNGALKHIQDSLGVDDGGFAGAYFSDDAWDQLIKPLVDYIRLEAE